MDVTAFMKDVSKWEGGGDLEALLYSKAHLPFSARYVS